jgi:aldehyde dehydrogenase (NAD+)
VQFPLGQIALKIAPAIMAGCIRGAKPQGNCARERADSAEIIHEADIPPGVLDLAKGFGPMIGEVLANHPEIDMVSFIGSTRASKRVSETGQPDGQAGNA